MSRPLKLIPEVTKQRNGAISPETARYLLVCVRRISRKIAADWRRYADIDSLSQDITTEVMVAILTSETFNPNLSPKQLYRYVEKSAKAKGVSLTKSFQRHEQKLADFETMYVSRRCRSRVSAF